jgi:Fe-S-cluster containining protein
MSAERHDNMEPGSIAERELIEKITAAVHDRIDDESTLDRIADVILDEARLKRALAQTGSRINYLQNQVLGLQKQLREILLEIESLIDIVGGDFDDLRHRLRELRRAKILELFSDPAIWPSMGIRVHQDGQRKREAEVDCFERHPICKGGCCYLDFALTWPEVEAGVVEWDDERPFSIRHCADGYCTHWDQKTHLCKIHEDRPQVCRGYSCRNDKRIWEDFEAKKLNPQFAARIAGLPPVDGD